MDRALKLKFQELYANYFPGQELPITFFFSDTPCETIGKEKSKHVCLIGNLAKVRRGQSLSLSCKAIGCPGGKVYSGFIPMPDFIPNFVSLEEKYKPQPEDFHKVVDQMPLFLHGKKYIIFKRWDNLDEEDQPEGVIFFATPDALSGLVGLCHYASDNPDAVVVPWGAGCTSIITYSYAENQNKGKRAFLGMFDPSARPFVPADMLTFALPMGHFSDLVGMIEKSFLTTHTWEKVKARLEKRAR